MRWAQYIEIIYFVMLSVSVSMMNFQNPHNSIPTNRTHLSVVFESPFPVRRYASCEAGVFTPASIAIDVNSPATSRTKHLTALCFLNLTGRSEKLFSALTDELLFGRMKPFCARAGTKESFWSLFQYRVHSTIKCFSAKLAYQFGVVSAVFANDLEIFRIHKNYGWSGASRTLICSGNSGK